MKRIILFGLIVNAAITMMADKKTVVDRIEPTGISG